MALYAIVGEVMISETDVAITYSNDDSSIRGVGSHVVQSLTINGVQRSLPTLAIFTENRESLKDLERTTLQIFSDASGNKNSEQVILNKISFVMTYSIAHNIKVIGQVAEKLNVDHIPKTLLCNVHPLMMDIHNSLGNKKK